MTNREIKNAVSKLIPIAVSNNPSYILSELSKRGLSYQYVPVGQELETKLYEIYMNDPSDFFNLMAAMPFDTTKVNMSTSPDTMNYLRGLAVQLGVANETAKIDIGGIWNTIVATIGGQSTSVTDPTIVTTETANIGAIIGLVAVAALAVFIVYIAFFKK